MSPPGRPKGEYRSAHRLVAPVLVFGWGNLSRGDDALGPMLVERLRAEWALDGRFEFLDDYQLQVEHALDLEGRERVLFVDASQQGDAPFGVAQLRARRGAGISTHAISPEAVMQVYCDLLGRAPPPCTLLAIRGASFELGEAPRPQALVHLEAAQSWAQVWLSHGAAAPQPEPHHA